MLAVFRIVPDLDHFAHLKSSSCSRFLGDWKFDGTRLPGNWRAQQASIPVPKVLSSSRRLAEPDIWSVCGTSHVLAFSEQAYSRLDVVIRRASQVFDIPFRKSTLKGVSVTECIDVLDRRRSRRDLQNRDRYSKYVFHANRIGPSLFSIPETATFELFAAEGNVDRSDEFKGIIEDNGFTGIRFECVWTNRASDE